MTGPAAAPVPPPEPLPGSLDFQRLATTRAAQDRLLERVRLTLDGEEFVLPVLKSGPNARWLESLETETRGLLNAVQSDGVQGPAIVDLFLTGNLMPKVRAALFAYDWTHVLPPEAELSERLTDVAYVRALLEVWAAAHPLVGIAMDTIGAILTASSSLRTSTPRRSTAGRRRGSGKN